MRWPPNKSWTSASLREGFRHFVAINYGGKGNTRWVLLVSVLDGKSRLLLPWTEMNDSTKWTSGWLKLSRDESNPSSDRFSSKQERDSLLICLHASQDSGLTLPSDSSTIRPWLENNL